MSHDDRQIEHQFIEAAIKLGVIFVLLSWCFQILQPFILLVVWAAILAVALYPLHQKLSASLGGKTGLSATLITLIGVAIILVPLFLLGGGVADSAGEVMTKLDEGTLDVPPPKDSVKEWPLVGESLHKGWLQASNNLERFMTSNSEAIKEYGGKALSMAGGALTSVLMFTVALIIGGVFMAKAPACTQGVQLLVDRITNHEHSPLPKLAAATVRSVAVGVLGVAAIQAALGGIGMAIMGVPATWLWTVLILVCAIAQLPPILILGPVAAYVFSVAETTPAVIFLVWSILVSASDGILKPMLLGKGVSVPTLVILLGAIGGMMMSGIIGLFVGAVVLALTYTLLVAWLTGEGIGDTAEPNDG